MKTIIFLIYLTVIQVFAVFGQDIKNKIDATKTVFWITLKTKKKINSETKKEVFIVKPKNKKTRTGTVLEFEKSLWSCLNSGKKIAIGPFLKQKDAERAIEMYDLAKHTSDSMEKEISNINDTLESYYWFFIDFKPKRTHTPILRRNSARLNSGNLKDFKSVLWEGLVFKQLAFGPYATEEEAKEARRLYRLEGD